MSLSSQRDNDHQDYQLVAKIDNAKNVLQLLKAVNFKDVSNKSLLQSMYHSNLVIVFID